MPAPIGFDQHAAPGFEPGRNDLSGSVAVTAFPMGMEMTPEQNVDTLRPRSLCGAFEILGGFGISKFPIGLGEMCFHVADDRYRRRLWKQPRPDPCD